MAKRKRVRGNKKKVSVGKMLGGFFGFLQNKVWMVGVIVLISLIALGMKYALHNDPAFIVTQIQIKIDGNFSKDEILDIAAIHDGTNIFDVDLQAIADRLNAVPRVRTGKALLVLPDTIRIEVEERLPFCQVKIPARDKYYLLDKDGYVLTPILKTPRSNLIVLEDDSTRMTFLVAGERFFDEPVQIAFRLIGYCSTHALLNTAPVEKIRIEPGNSITVIYDDSLEIRFGANLEKSLTNLEQIQEVLQKPVRDTIQYIDLRFKDPVIRKR